MHPRTPSSAHWHAIKGALARRQMHSGRPLNVLGRPSREHWHATKCTHSQAAGTWQLDRSKVD
eukprot:1143338-Pelagomonas_calceolata.AAC.3